MPAQTPPRPGARPWVVSPHGPLEKLEDNLWVVEGTVPVPGGIKRRMSILRRADGTLVFYHAMPLGEAEMAQIAAWGKPDTLVVAHDQHAIDAEPFAERLGLRIYGPQTNLGKLRARGLQMAGGLADMPQDPGFTFEEMAGTSTGEAVCVVRHGDRASVLFADCCQNSPKEGMWLIFRLLGFSGGPKVVPAFRMLFRKDAAAMGAHFERIAATPGLSRIVPFHGTVVETDVSAVLRQLAAS